MLACPKCGNREHFDEVCYGEDSSTTFWQDDEGKFTMGEKETSNLDEVHFRCGDCGEELDELHDEFVDNIIDNEGARGAVRIVITVKGGTVETIHADFDGCRALVIDRDVENIGGDGWSEQDVEYDPDDVEKSFDEFLKAPENSP